MYTCKKFKSIIGPYGYKNGIGRVFVLSNNIHRTQQFLNVEISPQTGPLDLLMGRRAIVFLDLENIEISAYNLGFKVLYKELTQKFKLAAKYSLHAFFSTKTGDRRAEDLQSMGWICHTRSIDKEVKNFKEQKRLNNSDAMLLLSAGSLITRSDAVI
ncbi:MAG: hypothetical protein QY317_16485 [Candidatus Jettenia caeni]|nr:MAG: hypothetical protein QY317_16485 [Candidatus Jettenia caeni]